MSVEAILQISTAAPTMGFVKDEAGNPLDRVRPLHEGSSNRIGVFSGSHGRTLLEEMRRGSSGSMPAASFADLYAATWDLWHAGKRREAMEMHGRTLLVLTEMNNHGFVAMKYILHLRGVFENYGIREGGSADFGSAAATAGARKSSQPALDEAAQQSLRKALDFVKPYLRT